MANVASAPKGVRAQSSFQICSWYNGIQTCSMHFLRFHEWQDSLRRRQNDEDLPRGFLSLKVISTYWFSLNNNVTNTSLSLLKITLLMNPTITLPLLTLHRIDSDTGWQVSSALSPPQPFTTNALLVYSRIVLTPSPRACILSSKCLKRYIQKVLFFHINRKKRSRKTFHSSCRE